MDISGEHHLDVLHSVYKTRLSEDGQPIHEDTEQYDVGESKDEEEGKPDNKVMPKAVKTEEKHGDECGRYVVWWVMGGGLVVFFSSSVAMELKQLSSRAATLVMMCEKPTG